MLDSLKDVALKLSDDEVGAAVNRAIQTVIADGVEVASLHHPRKVGGEGDKDRPKGIDDLYGSTWLTAGAGSVLYLAPGEAETFTLTQFKTPVGEMAEITYEHDHEAGTVRRAVAPDLLSVIEGAGSDGITVEHIARCFLRIEPEPKHVKAVRRKMKDLEEANLIEEIKPTNPAERRKWRSR